MKPKNLKVPFTWENREPLLKDRVIYVPKYYTEHSKWQMPDWSDESLFGNSSPICVEFCSGNGLWLQEKALAHPEKNWIGVEKRFDRVRKIWAKIKNYSLKNLIVVCGQAESFIDYYVKENTFSEIYINFPDPWPKEKHAKNRIFQKAFIDRLSAVSKPLALGTFVTDDEVYSHQMIQEMSASRFWSSSIAEPYFKTDWPEYGSSYFDELWRSQGKEIRYIQYQNTK